MTQARLFVSILIVLGSLSVTVSALAVSDSVEMISQLLTGDPNRSLKAAMALSQFAPDSLAKWITSFREYPKPERAGQIMRITHRLNDSCDAPVLVYVPSKYDPKIATPLFVYLHGGVSRPAFPAISDSELLEDPLLKLSEQNGWFYVFPLSRFDCVWWSPEGVDHIQWLVREMKRRFHIDDSRVSIGGFSDGGSGSFHIAMTSPTDFANLFPWSGHMAVGSLDGPMQQHLPNMMNRPLYATVGGKDQLYPTVGMLPMLQTALKAGANLNVTVYDTATHNDSYLLHEFDKISRIVNENRRDPLRSHIYWETSDVKYGKCDWFTITALDTTKPPAEWHKTYDCMLVDDRVTVGFQADQEWKGEGVKVGSVMSDTTSAAYTAGLLKDDVIIALDAFEVKSMRDLSKARSTKKRGDAVTLTVLRNEKKEVLHGKFPPVQEYAAFPRKAKSGAVSAIRIGNRFEIETSGVKSIEILLNPEMINFDQPVVIIANGIAVFDGIVKKESKLLLDHFLQDRDRELLWFGRVTVSL
ncbi:MAG: PDZ domain-containing protein [bacterium]|nr:PDZ domain-containing protein [bacterium]